MVTRIFVNNYRCLVNFTLDFEPLCVICGPNGAGKSSVFDALRLICQLGTGILQLGGNRRDGSAPHQQGSIAQLEFTKWSPSRKQEFELHLKLKKRSFVYKLELEQATENVFPRVSGERATCDDQVLFERDVQAVRFPKADGGMATFPLEGHLAALPIIRPEGPRIVQLRDLQEALAGMVVIQPDPRGVELESRSEARLVDSTMSNLISWYRTLQQDMDWAVSLRDSLQSVWPDFHTFRLVDVGSSTKMLQLRFDRGGSSVFFSTGELSDGERALLGLYMMRAALDKGLVRSVFIDEPDNFVGLKELQPWVLAMRELLDSDHQLVLISHNAEVLSNTGEESGRYVWRDDHVSPSRCGSLKVPSHLSIGEAIARGWIDGE